MKATTYETAGKGSNADHCDKLISEKFVTVLSVRGKTPPMLITRRFEHCDKLNTRKFVTVVSKKGGTVTNKTPGKTSGKFVTVLMPVTEFYWKRLRMSKRKIKAIWLTVERVAELMQRSNRTVWRFVNPTLPPSAQNRVFLAFWELQIDENQYALYVVKDYISYTFNT